VKSGTYRRSEINGAAAVRNWWYTSSTAPHWA